MISSRGETTYVNKILLSGCRFVRGILLFPFFYEPATISVIATCGLPSIDDYCFIISIKLLLLFLGTMSW